MFVRSLIFVLLATCLVDREGYEARVCDLDPTTCADTGTEADTDSDTDTDTDTDTTDSDADGYTDVEEAAAGTRPDNPQDFLDDVDLAKANADLDSDGLFGVDIEPGGGSPDLAASDPVLAFKMFNDIEMGDRIAVERWNDSSSLWLPLTPEAPSYGLNGGSIDSWGNTTPQFDNYQVAQLPLNAGTVEYLRFVLRSDASMRGYGLHLDDFHVIERGTDVDGDGVPGWLGEYLAQATDPNNPDTDGDGTNDGDDTTPTGQ